MRCKNARILISASMDGELSQREERVLRRHIRKCVECAREQAEVSNLRDVMSMWTDEEPSDWLAQSFAYRLQDEMERRPARRARMPRRVFGTALAGFATALLAFGIIMHSQLFPPENSVPEKKPTVNVAQSAKPNSKPTQNDKPVAVVPPKTDHSDSGEHAVTPPKPPAPKRNIVVRVPDKPTYVPPRTKPRPNLAPTRSYTTPTRVNAGPGPLSGRVATMVSGNAGSRTRPNDLASRGSGSRDADIKRMILRKLAMASNVEDDSETTVATQLARADLSMNESVEEVRGLLRKAADNLSQADYRVNMQ